MFSSEFHVAADYISEEIETSDGKFSTEVKVVVKPSTEKEASLTSLRLRLSFIRCSFISEISTKI